MSKLSELLIEVIEDRDDNVTRALIDGVREFSASVMGHADSKPLSVIARDPEGQLIAGVSGRTIYGHFLIEVVWVDESRRGVGLGTRLMNEAEQRARQRGCTGAQVDTTSFQAPDFYKKLGFRIIGTVEDFPAGHDRFFMRKDYA
ncbi:MAG: GNAT family N-acetyltransferase [Acidobacteriota bacterium]